MDPEHFHMPHAGTNRGCSLSSGYLSGLGIGHGAIVIDNTF